MYKKLASIITVFILLAAIFASTALVKASPAEIELSSYNLVGDKVIEIVITAEAGLGELELEVYDADTGSPASLQDVDGNTIDFTTNKLVATERASGVYVAYLGGNGMTYPTYPKVTLDDNATSDNKVNIAWFTGAPDGKTYVVHWIGTDVKESFTYDYVTASVSIDREPANYPLDNGWIRITLVDQDHNKDPTEADTASSDDILVTYIRVTRPSTGDTWEITTADTLTNVFFGGTASTASESAVNSGSFTFEASLNDFENYLATNIAGFVQFENGDIIDVELKGNAGDSDTASFTFTVKSVTPALSFKTVSFSEEITVSIDWFDYNVKSWDKDTIPAGVVKLYLLEDGTVVETEAAFTPKETDVNTGIFEASFELKLGDAAARADDDNVIIIDPRDVAAGHTYKLKLEVPSKNVEAYYDITFTEPVVSLDKSEYYPTDTMTITIVDPDLNDDAAALESYRKLSVAAGTEIDNLELQKNTIPYVKITLEDLTEGKYLAVKSATDFILKETGLNTGVFTLDIDLSNLEVSGGGSFEDHTIRLTVYDYTSGKKISTDFQVLKLVRTVELDRATYPVPITGETLKVHVKITAPDKNVNKHAIDTIPAGTVYIDVKDVEGNSLAGYPVSRAAEETDLNTGVFTFTESIGALSKEFIGGKIIVWYDEVANGRLDSGEPYAEARLTVTTASINVTPAVIEKYGDTLTIEITDPDKNLDSESIDSVSVDVGGTTYTADETDANSGVFKLELTVAQDGDIYIPPADELKIKYTDEKTAASSAQVGFLEDTLSATVKMKSHTGILTTDKTEYGPSATISINVTDPDLNKRVSAKDTLPAGKITLTIEGVETVTLGSITETGINTGQFVTDFNLRTYNPKDIIGKRILIAYQDDQDETGSSKPVIVTVKVVSKDPTITFDKEYYNLGDNVVITVDDLDANEDPNAIDTISLRIYSSSDPVGIVATAYETEENSGVFTAKVVVSDTFGAGKIYAKYGDKIYVEYKDEYPADFAETGKAKIFTAEATVGVPVEKPFEVATPKAVEPATGAPVNVTTVGKMVAFSTEIKNIDVVDRTFAYVVQVKDASGVVVYLSYIEGTVPSGYSFTPTISWTPTAPGVYTVEVFVWKSVAQPVAYSPVLTLTITVSE